jgi:gamma-glutamyl-gamma-aminobutyrate hydrolase PuuD
MPESDIGRDGALRGDDARLHGREPRDQLDQEPDDAIRRAVEGGTPFLGICLGLQLQCATTPGQRRRVWSRVCEIKALQRQLAAEHAADPRNDP